MFWKISFSSIINFLLWEYASNLLQACTVLFTYLEKKTKQNLLIKQSPPLFQDWWIQWTSNEYAFSISLCGVLV